MADSSIIEDTGRESPETGMSSVDEPKTVVVRLERTPSGRTPSPPWLNAAFAEGALRASGDAEARVTSISSRYATAIGDNYLSRMFRVTALLDSDPPQRRHLIVKCLPEGEKIVDVIRQGGYFNVESRVFTTIIPPMQALLDEALGTPSPLTARCLHVPNPDVLVLEDLRPKGFVMADRYKGLDYEHAAVVIRTLARWHAASSVLLEQQPELCDGLLGFLHGPNAKEVSNMVRGNIRSMVREVRAWSGHDDVADRFEGLADTAFAKGSQETLPQPCSFNVLCHGDMWVNNVLFRYEESTPVEARFVDMQLSHVGSPAVDLLLFRHSSLQMPVWKDLWSQLLEEYQKELSSTLKMFGRGSPSLEELERELHRLRTWGFIVMALWTPIVRVEPGSRFDVEASMEETPKPVSYSPEYLRWLRGTLHFWPGSGLFDD